MRRYRYGSEIRHKSDNCILPPYRIRLNLLLHILHKFHNSTDLHLSYRAERPFFHPEFPGTPDFSIFLPGFADPHPSLRACLPSDNLEHYFRNAFLRMRRLSVFCIRQPLPSMCRMPVCKTVLFFCLSIYDAKTSRPSAAWHYCLLWNIDLPVPENPAGIFGAVFHTVHTESGKKVSTG